MSQVQPRDGHGAEEYEQGGNGLPHLPCQVAGQQQGTEARSVHNGL